MLSTKKSIFRDNSIHFRWISIGIKIQFCINMKSRFQLTNECKEKTFTLEQEELLLFTQYQINGLHLQSQFLYISSRCYSPRIVYRILENVQ